MVNRLKRNISRTNELQVFTDLNNLHFVSDFQNFDDHLIVSVKSEGFLSRRRPECWMVCCYGDGVLFHLATINCRSSGCCGLRTRLWRQFLPCRASSPSSVLLWSESRWCRPPCWGSSLTMWPLEVLRASASAGLTPERCEMSTDGRKRWTGR